MLIVLKNFIKSFLKGGAKKSRKIAAKKFEYKAKYYYPSDELKRELNRLGGQRYF
jgi:hypothetical protein